MSKTSLIIWLILLVLCGYGVYSWYSALSRTVAGSPHYDNGVYGIKFGYPGRYQLQEREVGDAHRYHHSIVLIDKEALKNAPKNSEGPPVVTLDIFQNNLDKQSIGEWVKGSNNSNFKLSPDGVLASTTVAGADALSYTWDGLYRGDSVVLAHKDNIVMFSVMYDSPEDKMRKDFSNILSSLTLY